MIVGHNQQPITRSEARAFDHRGRVAQIALAAWKSLYRIELFALVDDYDVEAKTLRERRRGGRDVARPEHDQPRPSFDRLQKELHLPATAHAEIAAQIAHQRLRPGALLDLPQSLEHRKLDRA